MFVRAETSRISCETLRMFMSTLKYDKAQCIRTAYYNFSAYYNITLVIVCIRTEYPVQYENTSPTRLRPVRLLRVWISGGLPQADS